MRAKPPFRVLLPRLKSIQQRGEFHPEYECSSSSQKRHSFHYRWKGVEIEGAFDTRDLRTSSSEYEEYKKEYMEAQKEVIQNVIEVAFSYIPLFHTFSALVATVDVLAAFAEVSITAAIPYTRPTLLDIEKENCGMKMRG